MSLVGLMERARWGPSTLGGIRPSLRHDDRAASVGRVVRVMADPSSYGPSDERLAWRDTGFACPQTFLRVMPTDSGTPPLYITPLISTGEVGAPSISISVTGAVVTVCCTP